MDTQLDPQVIINDLLEQIKKLTLDNSMLRAYINQRDAAQVPFQGGPPVDQPEVSE